MSEIKTFSQQIVELKKQIRRLDDDFDPSLVEETASRLAGCNFAPPIITPTDQFLRMRSQDMLGEIDRILALPDAEACALAPDDTRKCEDLRLQYITVLIFYYKKLIALRKGNAEEWDEIDELYVHD